MIKRAERFQNIGGFLLIDEGGMPMGKKDTVEKEYMSIPEYFADAFNYYLFEGQQFIKADDLSEKDPTELELIFNNDNKEIIQKVRDVLKQCILMEDEKYTYLILGIENQSFIHYALPVKNMIYDALNYGQQVSEKIRFHRKQKDIEGDEFLSGFAKRDRLKPVVTLVIYFGAEIWDGPRTLKEMFEDVNENILSYVTDYKVNLLIPKEIEDFSKFKTDFGKAMKYIAVSDDEEAYEEAIEEEKYRIIGVETARLLNECIGMNIPIEKGVKQVKVCKAVMGIQEKARLEGIQVLIESLKELGQPVEATKAKIIEKYMLDEDKATEYMEKYW